MAFGQQTGVAPRLVLTHLQEQNVRLSNSRDFTSFGHIRSRLTCMMRFSCICVAGIRPLLL